MLALKSSIFSIINASTLEEGILAALYFESRPVFLHLPVLFSQPLPLVPPTAASVICLTARSALASAVSLDICSFRFWRTLSIFVRPASRNFNAFSAASISSLRSSDSTLVFRACSHCFFVSLSRRSISALFEIIYSLHSCIVAHILSLLQLSSQIPFTMIQLLNLCSKFCFFVTAFFSSKTKRASRTSSRSSRSFNRRSSSSSALSWWWIALGSSSSVVSSKELRFHQETKTIDCSNAAIYAGVSTFKLSR